MVVVQNMSGAGSNRAAGYIYSVAPKDGTAAAAIFPGAVLQPLLSDVPVSHDPNKLIYLGSANSDVYVCYVRSDAPVKAFEDVLTHELIVGASNPGATTYDLPLLLNSVLGAKFKIVTGYPGSREITLALERGEVQGACGIGWTGIEIMHPDWFSKDTIRVLVQLSNKGHDDLNKRGVPRAADLARTALRKAFVEALNDKALRVEAAKMQLDVDPMAGDELQTLVASLYATPPHLVERARQALSAKVSSVKPSSAKP